MHLRRRWTAFNPTLCVGVHVCQSLWRAVQTLTQVTLGWGPPPRLLVATDGYAMVFRCLSSHGLSDAHKHCKSAHTHIFCTHGGTQLANFHILCFFVYLFHAHSHTPAPPQVCVCVCVQPSSLIMSVSSVLVCVNCLLLAGPSVLWLQSWWWFLSCLSSLPSFFLQCPLQSLEPNNDAA